MINDKIDIDTKVQLILEDIEAYMWPEDEEPTVDATTLYSAKQALLTLIEEVFEECKPDKRPDTDAQDLRSGSFVRGQDGFRAGYNTAIQDFEANFKKVMGK